MPDECNAEDIVYDLNGNIKTMEQKFNGYHADSMTYMHISILACVEFFPQPLFSQPKADAPLEHLLLSFASKERRLASDTSRTNCRIRSSR